MIGKVRKDHQCSDQVKQILTDIIQAASTDTLWSPTLTGSSPKEILKGAEAQQRIGWVQVIYGHLAWAFIQMLAPAHSKK
jgi:hypothetical protein